MATVAELLVRIGGDSSGLRREINNSQRQLRRAFGPEALEMSEGAAGLLAGLAVAMGAVGVASIAMSSKLSQARSAFEVLLESGDKANKMISDLQSYATATSFNFDGLSSTAKSMLAVGIQGQDILPIIASVGDAIGTLGGGTEALQGVIRALSQIQAKGKLSAEEMNQLAERGIPGWRYLAESMGKSTAEVMKMTSGGAVDATTAINAIVGGMATQFKGGAEKANQEMTGQFESMKETATNIMAQIGDSITKSLDLKNMFSQLNDSLSQFSSVVQSSGIKTAILGLVPPEATAAVFALGGALIAVAIPAITMFAGALWLAIAPMAPFIALGGAIGLLAYEIWKNWEPMSDLFGGMWNLISNKTTVFLNDLQSSFYSAISKVMGYLIPLANLFGGSFQATVSGWGDNAVNQLERLSASSNDAKTKIESNMGVIKNSWNKTALGLKSIDIAGLIPGQDKPNTNFTGLHGNGAGNQMTDKAGEAAAKKAEKAWDQLEKKADRVSESIEKEWISLTGTQIDSLNNWKEDQMRILDESAAANENYQRDVTRLEEIYAEKKKKIIYDQLKDTNRIWDSAKEDAQEYQDKLAEIGLTGVDKQKFDIDKNASDEIDKMISKYRDLKAEYENGTKDQQEQFRNAWIASGIQFKITENGMVDFSKQTATNQLIIERDKNQKIEDLHYNRVKHQENLDKAYEDGEISRYMSFLNERQSLLDQSLAGQQQYMDAYADAWKATNRTALSYMVEGIQGFGDSFGSFVSDSLAGASSMSEAWQALGQSVRGVIAGMIADWIEATVVKGALESVLGTTGGEQNTGVEKDIAGWAAKGTAMAAYYAAETAAQATSLAAQTAAFTAASTAQTTASITALTLLTTASVAAAAVIAAAWAPAAAAVSLASFGSNSEAAMAGIAATYALTASLSVPGFAAGGAISGKGTGTSDSILMWGSSGEYMIQASAVDKFGIGFFNALNAGQMPALAGGGLVTGPSLESVSRYKNTSRLAQSSNHAGRNTNNSIVVNQNAPIYYETGQEKFEKRIVNKIKSTLLGG